MINAVNNRYYNSETVNKGSMRSIIGDTKFAMSDSGLKCPYSNLAKDGIIEYNGVTFCCDYKHNAITLGDVVSNPKKVLTIGLSGGGVLKVNVDNLDDLGKASGMFSPADLNAIMRAIQTYKHCTSKLNEIEDEENESPEEIAQDDETAEASKNTSLEELRLYNEEMMEKLISKDALLNDSSDIKLDYEERLSDEELERRIDMLFEDSGKNIQSMAEEFINE